MLWVTGAAGFIGSCFARQLAATQRPICLIDKLSYASNMAAIEGVLSNDVQFHQLDIGDSDSIIQLLRDTECTGIVNFAAESHVDRSIAAPVAFADNNVMATVRLLDCALAYWQQLPAADKDRFRFLQISTDEVFGALNEDGKFDEKSPYAPNSPYAASKAAADHFVRSYNRTYGFPTLTVHSSNNFGPWQHTEKFIPTVIRCAVEGQRIPIYGSGKQVRDWIFVEDNCRAIAAVLERGTVGENYCVGGKNEISNLELASRICEIVAEETGTNKEQTLSLITHVADRPGHDFRYAIDSSKVAPLLNHYAREPFEFNLLQTIRWYL